MPDPLAFYDERLRLHRAELARTSGLEKTISLVRPLPFLIGGAALLSYHWYHSVVAGAGGLALLALFAGLVIWHNRVADRETRIRAAIVFSERGLLRLKGELAALPLRGEKLALQKHPYASDIDLYGKTSVLQLLDALETDLSEERLGRWLGEPSAPGEVVARQEAVRELARAATFREELFVVTRPASRHDPELPQFFSWAREPGGPGAQLPLTLLGLGLPALTAGLYFGAARLGLPSSTWVASAALQWVLSFRFAAAGSVGLGAVARGAKSFGPFDAIVQGVRDAGFSSGRLSALAARLTEKEGGALEGLTRLDRLASWAEARESGVFRAFIAPLFLYDLHLLLALRRWRATYGAHVEGWVDAVAEVLSLAGLGTFAFDNPAAAFPDIEAGPSRFEAEALSHPLLPPASRVANDVRFGGPGTALLVTGSNMSGKSTLLRSMGVAVAMAQAGSPVSARRFTLSPLHLRTSIRVSDSLSSGVSHFYAELLALRRVVEDTKHGPVFFLLDEILHGTNSRERQVGAKGVIKHLLDEGAMGAVSTHDLGLSELVDELPGRVVPVHLMEQTSGETMTFDYHLREGLLRSGNALRLMKQLGLPVEPLAD